MPAIITSNSLPLQKAKELDDMYRLSLAEAPSEYDQLLKVETAPSGATYYSAEITGMGLPSKIGEGDGVPYDVPVEGNPSMRTYIQAGLGYIITDLMLKDEEFGKMKQLPADLARSMRLMMNLEAASFYSGLFATEVTRDTGYVCGTHTLLNDVMSAGSQTNFASTGGDLTESTFKTAIEHYDNTVDEIGAPMIMTPDKLIVSQADQYIARRLLVEMYGSNVDLAGLVAANADGGFKNFGNPENGFVPNWTVLASRFLDADPWFLRSAEHDLKWYWKEQPKQSSETEFDTDNIKYKAKMRYGIWADNWRGIYGNDGTA